MNESTCKGCGAPIVWAHTGKAPIPLDAKPMKRVILEEGPEGPATRARFVDTYAPHFATCPEARRFRKGQER